jgi:Tol biopolymer transport system component/tetratricopeptide (TPR) repeat protein
LNVVFTLFNILLQTIKDYSQFRSYLSGEIDCDTEKEELTMKKGNSTLIMIMILSIILAGHNSFAQTAGKLLPKAIQQEEVKGDLYEAIKTYQKILDEYPGNREICAEALLHLGICYEKLGLDQARETYRQVISKYPDQEDKAAMAKERIQRLDVYNTELMAEAQGHLKKGNELFKRWEYEEAIKEYENAARSGPNTELALNARYCIGQSWYRAGQYDKALATFTKLIEENPKSNIAPVTELMVAQVKYSLENEKNHKVIINSTEENTIVDPVTGIKFIKIKSFSGKNDIIKWTSGGFNISPDGRFMVQDNTIVPVDGSDYFDLVNMKASRASYSPDMKKAVFYADSAIWIVPVSPETGHANGTPVRLLDGKYRWQYEVSWSPDGQKIAFQRIDNKYAGSIWTITVKDGSLSQVTEEKSGYQRPVWSPDGKTIAYRMKKEMWLSPSEGGKPKKIIDLSGVPDFFSPDGKWLYSSSWDIGHQLFCLTDNRNIDLLTPVEVGSLIAFSTDSKRMIFFRPSYNNKWGLKIASPDGGPSYEPAGNIDVYSVNWSPNSKTILGQGENIAGLSNDVVYWIIPLEGGESHKLNINVNVDGKILPFDISPDQKNLAFTVARDDGNKDLYIVPISIKDAMTTGPARLVFEGWTVRAFNVDFSWSDDASKIALINNNNIWVIPLPEGKPIQITNNDEGKSWIGWSPNGKMLHYATDYIKDRTSRTLNVITVSDGNTVKIFENCKTGSWSPDSKQVSVYAGGKIYIMLVDGSNRKQIFDQADHGLIDLSSAKWSPDGKNLAFLGSDSEMEDTHLLIIPSEGGKITRLAKDDKSYKYSLQWSPDGKWLSYLTEESVKVRPEGTMWEADFEEVVEKLAK